eukprot:jgi/Mesvir1/10358/Mv10559-RA.1
MPNASALTDVLHGADEIKVGATAATAAADAKKAAELAKEIERLQALQKAEQASAAGKSADAVSEAASKSFRERATDFARRYGVEAVGGAFATVAGMLIVNSVFNKKDDKEGGEGTGAGDEEEGGSIADKIKSVMIVVLVITVVIGRWWSITRATTWSQLSSPPDPSSSGRW